MAWRERKPDTSILNLHENSLWSGVAALPQVQITVTNACTLIDWAVATRALAGQKVCGDQYLVQPFPSGVLVAVVDGLGHGEEAITAANLALAAVQEHAQEAVVPLLRSCHKRLQGTRGVVMSLASFSAPDSSLTWAGVGDVEGIVLRAAPHGWPARGHRHGHAHG